mmetsp:Transcript_3185/g.10506  ORF Transcript_3185/g.10506 Transcript_3185/m.10506 type:complete len:260 (+) Transcript_3185:832-1611(+)
MGSPRPDGHLLRRLLPPPRRDLRPRLHKLRGGVLAGLRLPLLLLRRNHALHGAPQHRGGSSHARGGHRARRRRHRLVAQVGGDARPRRCRRRSRGGAARHRRRDDPRPHLRRARLPAAGRHRDHRLYDPLHRDGRHGKVPHHRQALLADVPLVRRRRRGRRPDRPAARAAAHPEDGAAVVRRVFARRDHRRRRRRDDLLRHPAGCRGRRLRGGHLGAVDRPVCLRGVATHARARGGSLSPMPMAPDAVGANGSMQHEKP